MLLPGSTCILRSPVIDLTTRSSVIRGAIQSPQDLRSPEQLRTGIANFYDRSSQLWERIWGEHMHHGYYPNGQKKNHRQAQVDMIDGVLAWAGADEQQPTSVLDVGCGIGGSTRHIARKYGCSGRGITLSPVQAARAQQLSNEQGLGEHLSFQVADALQMPFEDNSFDLVWSLESGEHMPDKRQFVSELTRVVKPGGRVIIVTWCHRDLEPHESGLAPREERLLRKINRAFYLPRWCSVADYVGLVREFGLSNVRTDDWTKDIAQFWPAVIASAFRPRSILGLFRSGFTTLRGALVMPLMTRGYKRGLIKFGLITAVKPSNTGFASVQKLAKNASSNSESTTSELAPMPTPTPLPVLSPRTEMENNGRSTLPPAGFEWGGTF